MNNLAFLSEWEFTTGMVHAKGNVKTNSPNALLQLALKGVGIIRTSAIFLARELETKGLVPVLEKYWALPLVIYLHYRDTETTPNRIKVLVERLISAKVL